MRSDYVIKEWRNGKEWRGMARNDIPTYSWNGVGGCSFGSIPQHSIDVKGKINSKYTHKECKWDLMRGTRL